MFRNKPKKRVLVPYYAAGYGHVSFAKALVHHLKALRPEWEYRLFDPGKELADQNLDHAYVEQWRNILALPWIVKKSIFALEPVFAGIYLGNHRRIVAQATPQAARFLAEWKPDAIVPTHWGCSHLFAAARELPDAQGIRPPIWYVYSELGGHYRLLNCGADHYFALTALAKEDLISTGIEPGKIEVIDFIIQSYLQERLSLTHDPVLRVQARRELGLDPERYTVLYSLGGEGIGSAMDFLSDYYHNGKSAQIIVLTGKNNQLKKKIERSLPYRTGRALIRAYSFMPDLTKIFMACDAQAGKSGTCSVMEAIKMHKPLVICQPGAPNEEENMKYVTSQGMGWYTPKPRMFTDMVEELALGSDRVSLALGKLSQVGDGNGAARIAEYVVKSLSK